MVVAVQSGRDQGCGFDSGSSSCDAAFVRVSRDGGSAHEKSRSRWGSACDDGVWIFRLPVGAGSILGLYATQGIFNRLDLDHGALQRGTITVWSPASELLIRGQLPDFGFSCLEILFRIALRNATRSRCRKLILFGLNRLAHPLCVARQGSRRKIIMSRLRDLSDRLKAAQRVLIENAAQSDQLPPENVIRRISDLENAIVAVETLIAERED